MSPNFSPCNYPRPKMVTNSFGNRNFICSQWEGSTCTHEGRCFFLLGVGWVRFFLFFSLFPMCFQHVLSMFPKIPSCSLRRSQQHFKFIPYSLPRVQLPCISIEKLCYWGIHLFIFYKCGSKEVRPWGSAYHSKNIADGPMNMALSKKNKML